MNGLKLCEILIKKLNLNKMFIRYIFLRKLKKNIIKILIKLYLELYSKQCNYLTFLVNE